MSRKKIHRPLSWSQYNKSLVDRGSLTLWISDELLASWHQSEKTGKRGAPKRYSDLAILCANQIRFLYKMPLRAAEGFLKSLFQLLGVNHSVPDYTTIGRRLKKLSVPISRTTSAEPRDVVLDSTGLKVYGEGEWKVRQHGYSKRRTWRKIHLGFDAKSQEIVCATLTTNDFKDSEVLEDCLSQVGKGKIHQLCADGAYDAAPCYDYCAKNNIKFLTPPRKGAKIWQRRKRYNVPHPRDEALRCMRKHGRKFWRLNSGYSVRSLAETGMFRFKKTFTGQLSSRDFNVQANEAFIKCGMLNKIVQLGLPKSRVA
jgi:hypothetical protein